MSNWLWERIDTSRSGTSGDLAKLFKHEGRDEPGVLAVDAPSVDASLLAREVIQNSWDAASDLRTSMLETGSDAPDFEIEFQFVQVDGEQKRAIVEGLGLGSHAERAGQLDRSALGLGDSDCLGVLGDNGPIRLLTITESGTSGMAGPWSGTASQLYLALVSVGFTLKGAGAGGSYGYGKAGLIRGSAIRTVAAYTCFAERDDDPGVTRRFLGMTYWGLHEFSGESYSGFARLGNRQDNGTVVPAENEAADRYAEAVGIDIRSADEPEELGTTFLLIDPTISPDDLLHAIERNWWPALADPTFNAVVVDECGRTHVPRPRRHPVLTTFMNAYEVATVPRDNLVPHERQVKLHQFPLSDGSQVGLGSLGIVADPADWSYPLLDEPEAPEHRSLVALIRRPRMVVQYLDVGRTPPFVRGAFIADTDVDDLLRQSEPKLHDAWDSRVRIDGIDPDAPAVARAVIDRVRRAAGDFRRSLKPSVAEEDDLHLPDLERLFSGVFSDTVVAPFGGGIPIRDVIVEVLEVGPETHDDGSSIRMCAVASVRLSDQFVDRAQRVEVTVRYHFLEDDRMGRPCPVSVSAPPGFEASSDQTFIGMLTTDAVEFEMSSEPYDIEWSGRLVVDAALAEESELSHDV